MIKLKNFKNDEEYRKEFFNSDIYQLYEKTEENITLNVDNTIYLYQQGFISAKELTEKMSEYNNKFDANTNLLDYNRIILKGK